MDHRSQGSGDRPKHAGESTDQKREPAKSRWTPKPEQVLILESIFNSGMVNPPKEEAVRIRKMLENFGPVGDANVFYWFQNRRSRSRRRQRQIQQATLAAAGEHPQVLPPGAMSQFDHNVAFSDGLAPADSLHFPSSCLVGSGSGSGSGGVGENSTSMPADLYSFSGHLGFQETEHENPNFSSPSDASNLDYQTGGVIRVFINGVETEMEMWRCPLHVKAAFGGDFVLFHSSGFPLQVDDSGFLLQNLQHGESYFLVPRNS